MSDKIICVDGIYYTFDKDTYTWERSTFHMHPKNIPIVEQNLKEFIYFDNGYVYDIVKNNIRKILRSDYQVKTNDIKYIDSIEEIKTNYKKVRNVLKKIISEGTIDHLYDLIKCIILNTGYKKYIILNSESRQLFDLIVNILDGFYDIVTHNKYGTRNVIKAEYKSAFIIGKINKKSDLIRLNNIYLNGNRTVVGYNMMTNDITKTRKDLDIHPDTKVYKMKKDKVQISLNTDYIKNVLISVIVVLASHSNGST